MDIKTVLDIISGLITIMSLPILIITLVLLTRQLRIQAYQAIYESILSIDLFFVENSDLRPYINDGKPIPDDDPIEKNRIIGAIEMMVTFFGHVFSQRSSMPKDKWRAWEQYMCDIYRASPAMQNYLQVKEHWYIA